MRVVSALRRLGAKDGRVQGFASDDVVDLATPEACLAREAKHANLSFADEALETVLGDAEALEHFVEAVEFVVVPRRKLLVLADLSLTHTQE